MAGHSEHLCQRMRSCWRFHRLKSHSPPELAQSVFLALEQMELNPKGTVQALELVWPQVEELVVWEELAAVFVVVILERSH